MRRRRGRRRWQHRDSATKQPRRAVLLMLLQRLGPRARLGEDLELTGALVGVRRMLRLDARRAVAKVPRALLRQTRVVEGHGEGRLALVRSQRELRRQPLPEAHGPVMHAGRVGRDLGMARDAVMRAFDRVPEHDVGGGWLVVLQVLARQQHPARRIHRPHGIDEPRGLHVQPLVQTYRLAELVRIGDMAHRPVHKIVPVLRTVAEVHGVETIARRGGIGPRHSDDQQGPIASQHGEDGVVRRDREALARAVGTLPPGGA